MKIQDLLEDKNPKITWEILPAPAGKFRSFQKRGWPMGRIGDNAVIMFDCADEYNPRRVKLNDHKVIKVYTADWTTRDNDATAAAFVWKLRGSAATLADAKALGQKEVFDRPQELPHAVRPA